MKTKTIIRITMMLFAGGMTLLGVEASLRLTGIASSHFLKPGVRFSEEKTLEAIRKVSTRTRFLKKTFPLQIHAPKGVRRVFFFGGSAAQGFPYPHHSFASFFETTLNHSKGITQIQAINLGVLQFALRDVRRLFEELLSWGVRPDAVVIHSGNNELFYNRVRILNESQRPFHRFLKNLEWSRLAEFVESRLPSSSVPEDPEQLHRLYPLHENHLRRILKSFEKDLTRIIHHCQKENIPLILTTVPINRDFWSPSFFIPQDSTNLKKESLKSLTEQGATYFQKGEIEKARNCFQEVLVSIPEEPKSLFYLGRILLKEGRVEEARQRLELALRKDALRAIRSLPDFNKSIRRIAKIYQDRHVYLIDFDQYFLKKYGLVGHGQKFFIDHCHGTPEAYLEMGVNLASLFSERRVLNDLPEVSINEKWLHHLRKEFHVSKRDMERLHKFVAPFLEPDSSFEKEYNRRLKKYEVTF